MLRTFTLFFTIMFSVSAQLIWAEVIPIDKVIAIVNDDVILASQLQDRAQMVYQQARQQGQSAPPPQILVPQILDRLILESLQLQLADRAGVKISSEELNAALVNIARQNKIQPQQLQSKVEADGLSFLAFKKNIETELILQRTQQAAIMKRIKITEQEITDFLHSEEGKLALAEEFNLAHIVLSYPEGDKKEQSIQLAKAEAILEKLTAGEDFSELAKKFSTSPDAQNGGIIGWRSYRDVPSLYTGVVSRLSKNQISKPVVGSDAIYLLKLLDKKSLNQRHVEQTHVRHILIKPSTIQNNEEAFEKIKKIRAQVINGEDFAELAKAHSEDYGSALNGGDLDWVMPGQMVEQFQRVTDNTSIGAISNPFQTEFGWHILQVLDRREKDMGEEVIRQSVRNLLSQRQFEAELSLWLLELRADAFVIIKDPALQPIKKDE